MQVLVLVAPTHGVGRTTLVHRLAQQARVADGGPVVLLDADPEGDLTKRCADKAKPDLIVVPWDKSCAGPEFQQLRARPGGLIIIDAPLPGQREALGQTLSVADLVAVVVRPREDDFTRLGDVVEAIGAAAKPFVFLVNRAKRHGNMAAATAIALAQYGSVCPIVLPEDERLAPSLRAKVFRRTKRTDGQIKREEAWMYLSERLSAIRGEPRPMADDGPAGDRPADGGSHSGGPHLGGLSLGGPSSGAPVPGGPVLGKPERRHYLRQSFDIGATFSWERQTFPCRIRNISPGGLAFTTDMPVPVGTRLKLHVPYLGDFDAESVHRDSITVGLRFCIDEWQQAALVRDLAGLVGAGGSRERDNVGSAGEGEDTGAGRAKTTVKRAGLR